MNERLSRMDMGVFTVSLIMLGFSMVLVYSSSFAVAQTRYGGSDFFLERQFVRVILALICFVVFSNVDYHFWGKHSRFAYIAVIIMLAYVLLMPSHHAINGAKRWISLGFIQFQVSELALLIMVILFASRLQEVGNEIQTPKQISTFLTKIGILSLLIILEPNFSTASIVALIGAMMLFVAGSRFWHLAGLALAMIPVAVIVAISAPYRLKRILAFTNMSEHKNGIGYQAYQSLVGLGNGGLFGVGLGQGTQKYFYLPEPHTDFVFSILGEEIGFVGLIIVLALFAFLIYRGMKIAFNAPDKSGQLMAFGFSCIVAIYVIVHACVNTGLIPTTGIPLPFLSYGGMSLIFTMSSMGILLNISSQSKTTPNRVKSKVMISR